MFCVISIFYWSTLRAIKNGQWYYSTSTNHKSELPVDNFKQKVNSVRYFVFNAFHILLFQEGAFVEAKMRIFVNVLNVNNLNLINGCTQNLLYVLCAKYKNTVFLCEVCVERLSLTNEAYW